MAVVVVFAVVVVDAAAAAAAAAAAVLTESLRSFFATFLGASLMPFEISKYVQKFYRSC